MKALITGASSGLGADMARILYKKGYDLILVARRKERLESLKAELCKNADIKTISDIKIIPMDISGDKNAADLYEKVKNEDINILINNAGFGLFGEFANCDTDREMEMVDLNIKTLHVLTKLFLRDFKKKNKGLILNVASSAGLMPAGPLLSTYYATKSYVTSLTLAIAEELRREKSKVKISALCPGPFDTEFNSVAGVSFSIKGLDSKYVADYGIKNMFKGKKIIIPGLLMKLANFAKRLVPTSVTVAGAYNIQKKKGR